MDTERPGIENATWDDGEWVSWSEINSHLERLELQARFPNADLDLVPIFEDLISTAEHYYLTTGRHLQVYGDLGELFGAIHYGIKLHRNYAKGSDGRLGNDFVEVKTLTPFKRSDSVIVRTDRHFSKLLLVRITEDFEVAGKLIDRKQLPKTPGDRLKLRWSDFSDEV